MFARIATVLVALTILISAPSARAEAREVRLPRNCEEITRAVRDFTARKAASATAAQAASYGLRIPANYNPDYPLVVLVHGLDCDWINWGGMSQCLTAEGYQIGYFTY